jgi:hypothetical protein
MGSFSFKICYGKREKNRKDPTNSVPEKAKAKIKTLPYVFVK